jgi:hypothetical protein
VAARRPTDSPVEAAESSPLRPRCAHAESDRLLALVSRTTPLRSRPPGGTHQIRPIRCVPQKKICGRDVARDEDRMGGRRVGAGPRRPGRSKRPPRRRCGLLGALLHFSNHSREVPLHVPLGDFEQRGADIFRAAQTLVGRLASRPDSLKGGRSTAGTDHPSVMGHVFTQSRGTPVMR